MKQTNPKNDIIFYLFNMLELKNKSTFQLYKNKILKEFYFLIFISISYNASIFNYTLFHRLFMFVILIFLKFKSIKIELIVFNKFTIIEDLNND